VYDICKKGLRPEYVPALLDEEAILRSIHVHFFQGTDWSPVTRSPKNFRSQEYFLVHRDGQPIPPSTSRNSRVSYAIAENLPCTKPKILLLRHCRITFGIPLPSIRKWHLESIRALANNERFSIDAPIAHHCDISLFMCESICTHRCIALSLLPTQTPNTLWLQTPGPRPGHRAHRARDLVYIVSDTQ